MGSPQDLWCWNFDNHPIFKITILRRKHFLVQSAAQKWPSLPKMIHRGDHWKLFFTFSLFFFYFFITSPPLTWIIQPHKIVFVYTDTFGPSSCITSAILIIRSVKACFCCCFCCHHYWWHWCCFIFFFFLSFILTIFVYVSIKGPMGGPDPILNKL